MNKEVPPILIPLGIFGEEMINPDYIAWLLDDIFIPK